MSRLGTSYFPSRSPEPTMTILVTEIGDLSATLADQQSERLKEVTISNYNNAFFQQVSDEFYGGLVHAITETISGTTTSEQSSVSINVQNTLKSRFIPALRALIQSDTQFSGEKTSEDIKSSTTLQVITVGNIPVAIARKREGKCVGFTTILDTKSYDWECYEQIKEEDNVCQIDSECN